MKLLGIGNAPVSFGIWEEQRASAAEPGEADRFLSLLKTAGYTGTETGPPAYLGTTATIAERLGRHGLRLIGGYLPLRFSDREGLALSDAGWQQLADGVARAADAARSRGLDNRYR